MKLGDIPLLAVGLLLGACVLTDPLPTVEEDPLGSAGSPGTDAGSDAGGGCTVDTDCAARNCWQRKCSAGTCEYQPEPEGAPAAEQVAGDCKRLECDGAGTAVAVVDDSDLPVDESDCTIDSCSKGVAKNVPKVSGTPCTGGICDGDGICVQCYAASECPGSDSFCQIRTCVNNTCVLYFETAGTKLPPAEQTTGDCQVQECDGQGGIVAKPDDTDAPVDGLACTADACADGKPQNPPLAVGSACDQDGGNVCDASGACVECVKNDDCSAGVCSGGHCVSPGCLDKTKNGSETDVDCGGPECAPCALGKACDQGSDCASAICTGNVCKAPSCTDEIKNGSETDVDCGGDCPTGCAVGKACLIGPDCATGICTGNVCKTSSCTDGVQNGNETDKDCGGSCAPCLVGRACAVDGDCTTGWCREKSCTLLNACDSVTAVDWTGKAAATGYFGGSDGAYVPACFKVSVGTEVTFVGNYKPHPHVGGIVYQGNAIPDPTSPFYPAVETGSTYTWKLTKPGAYPFYCVLHYQKAGYYGTAYVVP
jgi:plastocyanin